MIDCDELIDCFQRLACEQIDLAIVAYTPAVAAMHIDLALFGTEQARFAEQLCDDS